MKSITIEKMARAFSLEVLEGGDFLNRTINQPRTHRPGLEFIGYFDYFPKKQVQILGKKEITYLHKLTEEERRHRIGNVVKYHPPCFIVTRGLEGLTYLRKFCKEESIPLLRTSEKTSEFVDKLNNYLKNNLAPEMAIHAVCMNVFGVGILLRGKSGIGKSETAHTLIGRSHRLIADDIVVLKKTGSQTILGTHNKTNKEFLALRSIGLLNVVRVYGRKAFQEETKIALDIELCPWEEDDLNNELELEPQYTEYLGVKIPHVKIHLHPGRDVAGLVEAACTNYYLMQQGYSAAEEFFDRIQSQLDNED